MHKREGRGFKGGSRGGKRGWGPREHTEDVTPSTSLRDQPSKQSLFHWGSQMYPIRQDLPTLITVWHANTRICARTCIRTPLYIRVVRYRVAVSKWGQVTRKKRLGQGPVPQWTRCGPCGADGMGERGPPQFGTRGAHHFELLGESEAPKGLEQRALAHRAVA